MPENPEPRSFNRRQFIRRGAAGAGVVVAAAGVAVAARQLRRRASSITARDESNPFAYDVTSLTRTDPRWLHFEEVGRIAKVLEDPRRIAIRDERIFLAAGNYVHVLNLAGVRESEIALTTPPRCLALGEDGTICVGLRDHLEFYDRQGTRRAVWDPPGARTWFTGVAIGPNDVFAADAGHRVVLRYDRSGKLIGRIGEKNQAKDVPGFVVPSPFFDLEWHRDGMLRVANPGRHQIEIFTPNGDFEWSWGKASAAVDGFCGCCNPVNFTLLADGRYVTCEKGLPRVKIYGVDGSLESVVAGPESFIENQKSTSDDSMSDATHGGLDVAVDGRGRVYILDLVVGDIRIMARKTGAGKAGAEAS